MLGAAQIIVASRCGSGARAGLAGPGLSVTVAVLWAGGADSAPRAVIQVVFEDCALTASQHRDPFNSAHHFFQKK